MSQQNGFLTYGVLSFFIVMTVVLGAVTAIRHSTATQLESELRQASRDREDAETALRREQDKVATLLTIIGQEGAEVGQLGDPAPNTVAGSILRKIQSPRVTDESAAASSLEAALDKAVTDRDVEAIAALSRRLDLQNYITEMQEALAAKDEEIATQQAGREKAEADLRKALEDHTEKLASINRQFTQTRNELNELQIEYADYRESIQRELARLEADNSDKRQALLALRKELFRQQDISFATPDGIVASVDQPQLLAYINLGSADGLREGTTFSVYTSDNRGVGRRNTDDIKGRIEVVDIMEPHLARASITYQDPARPVAKGDPIYSPVFTSGVPMEVAIAGLIDFDGSPGSDREELLKLITAQGARVAVQVDDNGNFVDGSGEILTEQEARGSITPATRFLIIGDLGEDASDDSKDEKRLTTYRQIQTNTKELRRQAENHAVFEVGLPAFLEFLGYTRKRQLFRSGEVFPRPLANGGRSQSVDAPLGNRESSAVISGAFSRRRSARRTSLGHVSGIYEK